MTACTPREEMEWRSRICRSTMQDQQQTSIEAPPVDFVALNVKPLGIVFRKPGELWCYLDMQTC
jgi:hypothetical protein